MRHAITHLLAAFPKVRVLIVGDLILDEYVAGGCDRVSPEAPVPILRVRETRRVLGGAANTAANVSSLGGDCTLVGMVGDDEAGHHFRTLCRENGISLLAASDMRPTTRKVRVVGDRQQVVRLDYEDIAPANLLGSRLWPDIEAELGRCDAVVVSDYAKGVVDRGLCERVFSLAARRGVPVVVDPRPQNRAHYRGCTLITPNWKEAQGLLGEPDRECSGEYVGEVGRRLAAELRATVVLTLGAQGIRVFPHDGSDEFDEPAVAREVFDVSGAGDTVVASLALCLGSGADMRSSVILANRAAGVVVGKVGTATISPQELLGFVGDERLVAREDLAALSRAIRQSGKRIVTINGSFDLLHAGHLYILEQARMQGEVLVVGLNSDRSVRTYKGPRRPIVSEADRARLLLGLRCVDFVHIFDEVNPIAFLEEVRPHVHVNGSEYGEDCIEAPTVRKHGGRLHLVERIAGLSSTGLVGSLASSAGLERPLDGH